MRKATTRFSTLAAVIILGLVSVASLMWAQSAAPTRLRVRKNALINGIEAQLRGDFTANPTPIRLNSDLENINIPVGTPVAFCLVQGTTRTLLGVAPVATVGGILDATFELNVKDGDTVPAVNVGDKLQARQSKTAPFNPNPNCSSPLLISGNFQ
jgi:hypothetical protein